MEEAEKQARGERIGQDAENEDAAAAEELAALFEPGAEPGTLPS